MVSNKLFVVGMLCVAAANASTTSLRGGMKPTDIIEKFRNVLPGAFPKGMQKYVNAANDIGQDIFHDVTGTTFASKEELEDAKRLMKFLASMNSVQSKVDEFEVDPTNEAEMKKATDAELNRIGEKVDQAAEEMLTAGVIKIEKPSLDGKPRTPENIAKEEEERGGMSEEEFEKAKKELEDQRKSENEDEDKREVPEHVREARRQRAQARRWRRSYKPQMKTSVMFNYGEEMVREIFQHYDANRDGVLELSEFNSLQKDTEGQTAIHTREQFVALIQEADPGRKQEAIRFKLFHDLYLEPDISAKFETVLPADYQRLVDLKAIKGTAIPGLVAQKAETEKDPVVKDIDA